MIQAIVEYYTLKMADGWHIVKKTEYTPPVEYDKDFMVVPSKKKADSIIANLRKEEEHG